VLLAVDSVTWQTLFVTKEPYNHDKFELGR